MTALLHLAVGVTEFICELIVVDELGCRQDDGAASLTIIVRFVVALPAELVAVTV